MFAPIQSSSQTNCCIEKFWRSIFAPFPLRTQSYVCALRHFFIAKYDFLQIELTEAEVDEPVANYARNFLRCVYV